MNPRTPTSRKTAPTTVAASWSGVRVIDEVERALSIATPCAMRGCSLVPSSERNRAADGAAAPGSQRRVDERQEPRHPVEPLVEPAEEPQRARHGPRRVGDQGVRTEQPVEVDLDRSGPRVAAAV